jgi:hypothetical protein
MKFPCKMQNILRFVLISHFFSSKAREAGGTVLFAQA